MFPNWHDELGVPTVGDDIIINHIITVHQSKNNQTGFRVAVQPKSPDGILREHARSIATLLQHNHTLTERLLDQYINSSVSSLRTDNLRVNLKNILENYRSSLEYIAHYMAEHCDPKPALHRVQFPVANKKDDENTFSAKLDKWFPKLSYSKPEVKKYIISIQHFKGESWLQDLSNLTNFNKHRTLSSQLIREFKSVLIFFDGVGVRLGNLGFNSIAIHKDGAIKFKGLNGNEASILGPCRLAVNNLSTSTFDDGIRVSYELHNMYFIPPSPKSLPHLVWEISKNVYRTVNNICALLS